MGKFFKTAKSSFPYYTDIDKNVPSKHRAIHPGVVWGITGAHAATAAILRPYNKGFRKGVDHAITALGTITASNMHRPKYKARVELAARTNAEHGTTISHRDRETRKAVNIMFKDKKKSQKSLNKKYRNELKGK